MTHLRVVRARTRAPVAVAVAAVLVAASAAAVVAVLAVPVAVVSVAVAVVAVPAAAQRLLRLRPAANPVLVAARLVAVVPTADLVNHVVKDVVVVHPMNCNQWMHPVTHRAKRRCQLV